MIFGQIPKLYLITKLQNLKAIHNAKDAIQRDAPVVSNYKITKSESYSQQIENIEADTASCI